MNIYYILAVLIGRLSSLISVVFFSYVLNARDFGTYSAMFTNAMLFYLLLGAWIPNAAWKEISQVSLNGRPQALVRIRTLVVRTAALLPLLSIPLILSVPLNPVGLQIGATALWSAAILIFDTVLVEKNAGGDSRQYATLTLARAVLGLILPALMIWYFQSFWGAVLGQIGAVIFSLATSRSTFVTWAKIDRPSSFSLPFFEPLKFGLISVFALNLYMIANAVSRNIILIDLGPATAGYFSLAGDMFYAPVALFAMSISLSKIPELYRSAANSQDGATASNTNFLMSNIAVILPYMVGGAFVSAGIAHATLSADVAQQVAAIAPLSVIQGGCLTLLATQTTIALTSGRVARAVGISTVAIALIALAQLMIVDQDSLSIHAQVVATVLAVLTVASILASKPLLGLTLPWREVCKVILACGGMGGALYALSMIHIPMSPFPEIVIGGACFLALAWLTSCQPVMALMNRPDRQSAQ
jgi:O-antigen/teichoic acid export membrane protein